MEQMITSSTHSISMFTFVVMGLTVVICGLLFLGSILVPEWKSKAMMGILIVFFVGLLFGFGQPFIDWLKTFNSF